MLRRCQMLMAVARQERAPVIARQLGCDDQTVRTVITDFNQEGMAILHLIPGVGRILNSVLSLYGIAIQVFAIMAAHRLSKGKAFATILIPLVAIGAIAGAYFLFMKK